MRFVVLTQARSGTHHLLSLLAQHPGLRIRKGEPLCEWDTSEPSVREQWPLAKILADCWPAGESRHCGFAAHLAPLHESSRLSGFWEHVRTLPDFRVVWLRRTKHFRRFVSEKLLHRDWRSHLGAGEAAAPPAPIRVKLAEFRGFVDNTRREWAALQNWLSDHAIRYAPIDYEQLAAEPAATMTVVFRFLRVPYRATQPVYQKQQRLPLSQVVENYAELLAEAQGTDLLPLLQVD